MRSLCWSRSGDHFHGMHEQTQTGNIYRLIDKIEQHLSFSLKEHYFMLEKVGVDDNLLGTY